MNCLQKGENYMLLNIHTHVTHARLLSTFQSFENNFNLWIIIYQYSPDMWEILCINADRLLKFANMFAIV